MDNNIAPYIPFDGFIQILDKLENDGIPEKIFGEQLSDQRHIQWTITGALNFFGLINADSTVNENIKPLVDKESRKEFLELLIKHFYAPLFVPEYQNLSATDFERLFKSHFNNGGTYKKAKSFFTKACQFANVQIPDALRFRIRHSQSSQTADLWQDEDVEIKNDTTDIKTDTTIIEEKPMEESNKHTENIVAPIKTEFAQPAFVRTIELASGGKLTLSAEVDVFELGVGDREFVFRLVDEMRGYEKNIV